MGGSRQERLREMVQNARHESVTVDALDDRVTSRVQSRLKDGDSRTVDYHLYEDEQPHFLFTASWETPNVYGSEKPVIPDLAKLGKVVHVVTDRRWLTIVGTSDGDANFEIDLSDIEATNYDTESQLSPRIPEGITNSRIILQTETLYFEIPVSNEYDEDDLVELCSYLRERVDARPRTAPLDPDIGGFTLGGVERDAPDEEDIRAALDDLPPEAMDEANELVAESDDADWLLRQLKELEDQYEESEAEETVDDLVAEAESVDDLREAVRTPMERRIEGARAAADAGAGELKRMAQADPEVVASHAIMGTRMAQPFAKAAPGASVGWYLGSLTIAAAAGAHSDTAEESVLDDIDLEELEYHISEMAGKGADIEELDGEAIGVLLGAVSYFGEEFTPEEYADWIQKADPEAVMEGIDRGAEFAGKQDESAYLGGVSGGALGLFGGYADYSSTDSDDDLSQLLDEDLYEELETEEGRE